MSCKVYGKFFKKHPKGFECLLCSAKQRTRTRIYQHIRNRHFNGMCLVKNAVTLKSAEDDKENHKGTIFLGLAYNIFDYNSRSNQNDHKQNFGHIIYD